MGGRYVIVLSDNGGGANCYGVFARKKAEEVFDQLLDVARDAGTDDDTQLSVNLHAIERWPGARAIRKQVV